MAGHLLNVALESRGPSEILQLADSFEHCCHGYLTHSETEAHVWTPAVMNIGIERPVENHLLRVGERLRIVRRSDLEPCQPYNHP